MRIMQDYKLSVKLSLEVMKRQREKLFEDSKGHYSVIYNGLHEFESSDTRSLYFQAYEMEWLDGHWNTLTEFLKQSELYNKKVEQKIITLFFAEYFSSLISELDNLSGVSKLAAPELIRSQQKAVEQMIQFADNWEESSNQLKVNLKKHREHYKRLIDNTKK